MGRLLYLSAAWTLAIKYVLPVGWALWLGAPLTSFIFFWDAWWVAHLAVGWSLVRRKRGVWIYALLLALVEIAIIVAKFALFLRAPVFDFWTANWFVNKCWLLGYFAMNVGNLIHILLVIAVIVILVRVLQGRKPIETPEARGGQEVPPA